MNNPSRRGDIGDVVGTLFFLTIVGIILSAIVGLVSHGEQKWHPVNAATLAPGDTVFHGYDEGVVLGMSHGGAESPALVRVRFRHEGGQYSEASFLPNELRQKDVP